MMVCRCFQFVNHRLGIVSDCDMAVALVELFYRKKRVSITGKFVRLMVLYSSK